MSVEVFQPEVVEGEIVETLFGMSPADWLTRHGQQELPPSSADEARERSELIRAGLVIYVNTRAAIAEAWARRDWEVLGYDNWDAYLLGEFGDQLRRLTGAERREAVAQYREGGMPIRAIAGAVQADKNTVMKDLSEIQTPESKPVASETAAPAEVTGADGKKYPSKREPKPAEGPSTQDKPAAEKPDSTEKPVDPTRPEDRPGYWSPEDRKAHEEEVQLQKDRESARTYAANIVTQIRTYTVTIITGYRLGEHNLVTLEQIADMRKAIDNLEKEVIADAQR